MHQLSRTTPTGLPETNQIRPNHTQKSTLLIPRAPVNSVELKRMYTVQIVDLYLLATQLEMRETSNDTVVNSLGSIMRTIDLVQGAN